MAARMRGPLNVFPDADTASRALADAFVASVRGKERFAAALSGGRTPRRLYGYLADERVSWSSVHVFWADERYVPPDHPDSNVGSIRHDLLDLVSIPESNIHPPPTDLPDPDEAARQYAKDVRTVLGESLRLDWLLLGLGEDGHTASLFPGSSASAEHERLVVAIRDSPKPPPTRLTMTPALINRSREIHMLVTGTAKRDALRRVVDEDALSWLGEASLWVDRDALGRPG